jgi:hypothetical protein
MQPKASSIDYDHDFPVNVVVNYKCKNKIKHGGSVGQLDTTHKCKLYLIVGSPMFSYIPSAVAFIRGRCFSRFNSNYITLT